MSSTEERPSWTADVEAGLRERAVRSGAATFAAQGAKFALQLAATTVLARLLAPADFGLFAVAFAIFTFISIFRDLGLSAATVQRPTVTHDQLSTVFWVTAAIGCGLALVTAAVAQLTERIWDEPGLSGLLLTMAVAFPFIGLSRQHYGLLVREMRFTALGMVEVSAVATGLGSGVAAAWLGAGYWSLVVAYVTTELIVTCGVWLISDWRPSRPQRGSDIRPWLGFGGYLTGFRLLFYFSHVFDNLLVGWSAGARKLGLYDRAYGLLLLPINQFTTPLGSVALATLSRLQLQPERYRLYLNRYLLVSVGLGMPLVAFLAVTANTVVPLLLGSQWHGAVPIFQALAPAAFVFTFTAGVEWVFLSLGRMRRQLPWAIITTIVTVLSFLVGLRWGPVGVAAAFSTWRVAIAVPTLIFTCRGSFVPWRELLLTVLRPAIAALGSACALAAAEAWLLPGAQPVLQLARDSVLYAALYIGFWMALPGGPRVLREYVAAVRLLWERPAAAVVD